MNTTKTTHKPKNITLTIRIGDLLPKQTAITGGKNQMIFGSIQYPNKKGRLPLIDHSSPE